MMDELMKCEKEPPEFCVDRISGLPKTYENLRLVAQSPAREWLLPIVVQCRFEELDLEKLVRELFGEEDCDCARELDASAIAILQQCVRIIPAFRYAKHVALIFIEDFENLRIDSPLRRELLFALHWETRKSYLGSYSFHLTCTRSVADLIHFMDRDGPTFLNKSRTMIKWDGIGLPDHCYTSLECAIIARNVDLVSYLCETYPTEKLRIGHFAIARIIELCFDIECDTVYHNCQKAHPDDAFRLLHILIKNGHISRDALDIKNIVSVILKTKKQSSAEHVWKILDMMIECGINLNYNSHYLPWNDKYGFPGFCVNGDYEKSTALTLIARASPFNIRLAEKLLRAGASLIGVEPVKKGCRAIDFLSGHGDDGCDAMRRHILLTWNPADVLARGVCEEKSPLSLLRDFPLITAFIAENCAPYCEEQRAQLP